MDSAHADRASIPHPVGVCSDTVTLAHVLQ